jgi:hypothetical protein
MKVRKYIDQNSNPRLKGKDIDTILSYIDTKKAIKCLLRRYTNL